MENSKEKIGTELRKTLSFSGSKTEKCLKYKTKLKKANCVC